MPEAHNNLGNAYRALGHFAEARWCYGEAVRLNPEMSQAYVSLGSDIAARRALGRGFALAPPRDRAPARLSRLPCPAGRSRRRPRAVCRGHRLLSKDARARPQPARPPTTRWAGSCRRKASSMRSAEHLRTALRLRPDLAIAHVNLGGLHEKTGRLRRGRSLLPDGGSRTRKPGATRWRGWPCSCAASCPTTTARRSKDGSLTRLRPTRPGSTCSSAWRTSGMRASVTPKPPTARATGQRPGAGPVRAAKAGATIRPSTSGSSRG